MLLSILYVHLLYRDNDEVNITRIIEYMKISDSFLGYTISFIA